MKRLAIDLGHLNLIQATYCQSLAWMGHQLSKLNDTPGVYIHRHALQTRLVARLLGEKVQEFCQVGKTANHQIVFTTLKMPHPSCLPILLFHFEILLFIGMKLC